MYAELPSLVAAGQGANGPKVSGSKAKPIPVRLDVLDLLAPANFATVQDYEQDQRGYASVATTLASWAYDWRDSLFSDQSINDLSVGGLVPWLRNRLDCACDSHPAIGEFASEVTRLHTTLLRLTERIDESNKVDADSVAQKLDAVKTASFTGTADITMPGIQLDALITAKDVALLFGVTIMTVSNWRRGRKLIPATTDKNGSNARYRLGDVLPLMQSR